MSIQSIERGAKILSLFSLSSPKLKLSQIAKELGVPLSTAHGLVSTLVETGFLNRAGDNREYQLGLWLIELGATRMATSEINQSGAVSANYLGRETGFIVRLGVLDRDAVVVTYCSSYPTSSTLLRQDLGRPVPTYCTALGRAILAFMPREELAAHLSRISLVRFTPLTKVDPDEIFAELEKVRTNGYSLVTSELVQNIRSIGAPIFGPGGAVIGGISLNGDTDKMPSGAELEELAKRVKETAAQISEQSGYWPLEPVFNPRR